MHSLHYPSRRGFLNVLLGVLLLVSAASDSQAEWRRPRKAKAATPPPVAAGILEDNAGQIEQVVIQVAQGQYDRMVSMLKTLLPQMESYTSAELVCSDGQDAWNLRREIDSWDIQTPQRFRVWHWPQVETIWARDRYLALRTPKNTIDLLTPPENWSPEVGDFTVAPFLAKNTPKLASRTSKTFLEGGDIIAGRRWVLVGATTVQNAYEDHGPLTEIQLRRMLEKELGKRVIFVPELREMQQFTTTMDYHLDMFLTVTRDDAVLLADVDWGARLGQQMQQQGVTLAPEDAAIAEPNDVNDARGRLELARRALARAGIKVRRVPMYPLPNCDCTVTYNNVVQEETPRGPVVYMPFYGAGPLDQEASKLYAGLGYDVRPVDVRQIYAFLGTVRCSVNVIRRSPVNTLVQAEIPKEQLPIELNIQPPAQPQPAAPMNP